MKADFDKYLDIDVANGICIWKNTIQSHRELIGKEAGSVIKSWKNKSGECRYEARIKHAGKYICLGSFSTPEEASKAYLNKRKEFLT